MISIEEPGGGCAAWGVLSLRGRDALVVDYLARDASFATFERLWNALRGEAFQLGARTLVFWESPGGPWRRFLLERLDGGRAFDAGYSLATAVIFDEEIFSQFVRNLHFTPACYDDR
jgi:hypothetical protein